MSQGIVTGGRGSIGCPFLGYRTSFVVKGVLATATGEGWGYGIPSATYAGRENDFSGFSSLRQSGLFLNIRQNDKGHI